MDPGHIGEQCVIVKAGKRVCGTGGALGNAPLVQSKSYWEVKLQAGGTYRFQDELLYPWMIWYPESFQTCFIAICSLATQTDKPGHWPAGPPSQEFGGLG